MRPCFAFKNSADATAATLSIYDEIGLWGVQASDFRAALSAVSAPAINLEINSPGGDVFAGIAIYNMLKASGKTINAKVMGVAASAASLILMAGDTREAPKNTFVMVHNPITGIYGNAEDLRASAEVLDKIGESLLATYVSATGMDEGEMKALLAKDTWLTADEALAMGFVTAVTDEVKADAAFDMDRADLPANVKAVFAMAQGDPVDPPADPVVDPVDPSVDPVAVATPVAEQVTALATAAGLADHAGDFALACGTVAEAETRIAVAREINALCVALKLPEQAGEFIKANKSLADVRMAIVTARAEADVHIDTSRKNSEQPTHDAARSAATTAGVWAKRRSRSNQKAKE